MFVPWTLAALGALALAFVVVIRLKDRRVRPAFDLVPENSHPGRVIPPGTTMAQVLQASPDDLAELALIRKPLPPEVAKIREEKPRLVGNDPKSLLRRLLDGQFDGHLFLSTLDEQAILGAILVGNIPSDALLNLPRRGCYLTPSIFRNPKHGLIYAVLLTLEVSRQPVEQSLVCDFLSQKGFLEYIGGESYLKSLIEMAATKTEALRILKRCREH